jgi:hypothetical protein
LFLVGDGPDLLVSTKVTGCTAGRGGGVYVFSSAAANGFVVTDYTISGNTAASSGGGLTITVSPDFHISGSSITNNWAFKVGGILVVSSGGGILDTTISLNVALSDAGKDGPTQRRMYQQ